MINYKRKVFLDYRQVACILLVNIVWLWPFVDGPMPEFWPNFTALLAGIFLWLLLPASVEDAKKYFGRGIVIASVVSACMAIFQFFGVYDRLAPWVYAVSAGSAVANVRQTNQLATFLCVGLMILLAFEKSILHKFLIFILVFALVATASRTGFLLLLIVVAFQSAWLTERRANGLPKGILVLAIYLCLYISLPYIYSFTFDGLAWHRSGRLSDDHLTCESRVLLWKNVLGLISQRPWGGWGWGDLGFALYHADLIGSHVCGKFSNAHNLILQLAVELGVPATLIFVIGVAGVLWKLKPWREVDVHNKLLWIGLLLIGVHSLVEYPLWFGNFQVTVAISVWFLFFSKYPNHVLEARDKIFLRRPVFVIYGFLFFLIYGYIGFDYLRVSQLYRVRDDRISVFKEDTLRKAANTFFFQNYVLYSRVVTTLPTIENAASLYAGAELLLHFAVEPIILERLIESAALLGKEDIAKQNAERYRRLMPDDYVKWQSRRFTFDLHS